MHVHLPPPAAHDEGRHLLKQFGFAGFIGVLLLANFLGVFKTVAGIDTAAALALLAGYRTFYNSVSALLEKKLSADVAISIAVVAALAIGEYLAAAEAMFIMLIGEGLEGYAAGRTAAAIHRFVEQLPRRARVLRDGLEIEVDAASLVESDLILVRAGERIAADGVILDGASSIDESTITGEPLPRDKQAGDEVFSGTLNGHGFLRVRVTRAGSQTTLARVIQLVEQAREKRAPVERLADRYARFFLPALLLAGALTFYFTRDWLRTVSVLIVACPCALILATPAAMVAAMGGLARRGILVRGGSILQQASEVDTVVFDKTGTVTEGQFAIIKLIPLECGEDELLALAAAAERGSDHVLARVIVEEARRRGLAVAEPEDAHVLPGRGAACTLDGRTIRAGSAAFLAEHGIRGMEPLVEEADRHGATAVLVAGDHRLAGAILLRDRLREGIKTAVHQLEHLGITRQVMLTGDRRRAAEAIAREIGIPSVEAELLPEQKLDRVRQLAAHGCRVAMVGDGINDAPALAAAHVGVAVAGAADITAEAADVVYLPRSLERLPKLFEVSRRAVTIAWQNIIGFACLVNLLAVGAAALGKLGPIGAAATHQLASLLVMLNSLRLLKVERRARRGWLERLPATRLGEWWRGARRLAASVDPKAGFNAIVVRRRQLARPALITAAALVALNGFYTLKPEETGLIERFGRKVLPYKQPGLHYKLPWPIERLTLIQAQRVRVVEIGFRSTRTTPDLEPAAYEWNVQHRAGRFQRKPEESLMLSGDQNMIEVNATVHYQPVRPDDFLYRQLDGDLTVRAAAESVLQSVVTATPLDDVFTVGRQAIENRVRAELQQRLDRYRAGVEVLRVKLLDVHPSTEVVDAFREVAGAFEEKNRLINEAEGYRNEQVALARGNAKARLANAAGYSTGKKQRASGDAARFEQAERAFRAAPGPTETRLYLETMEQILPGKRKMIVDAGRGRRQLMLLEDGVLLAPPAATGFAPQSPFREEER
ncbi:MAG: FtsH protease activity modulator HflK [Acidobacteriota bacterium]